MGAGATLIREGSRRSHWRGCGVCEREREGEGERQRERGGQEGERERVCVSVSVCMLYTLYRYDCMIMHNN